MQLNILLKNIEYYGNPDSRDISYITHDSRKVKKGTLYIALKGYKNDGHDYIFDAIKKGAIAVIANGRAPITNKVPIIQVKNPRKAMSKIASNFFNKPSNSLKIIGITGTNGKTTTTQIINHILKNNKICSGSLGTLGFDTPSGIQSTNFTTPESIELQQILKIMKDGGVNYVPMEISSHAIEMNRIDHVNVKIAIFTNLGHDHLDFHGNIENYFLSKLKLFKRLNKKSTAIINADDKYFNRIKKTLKCQCLSFGFSEKADLHVVKYNFNLNGIQATLKYKKNIIKVETPLVGKFNLYNILASIICAFKIGVDVKGIEKALKTIRNIPGRFEKFILPKKQGYAIIDYAHSPDAYENIFQNIYKLKGNKKITTIFGCGGERDKIKRPLMAKIVENYSQKIIVTNDNPRNENYNLIIEDIVSGFEKNNYKIIKNRREAILDGLNSADNSIVLILGKGIENYQIIKDEKIPHSDIAVVKEYIHANRNTR